MRSGAKGARESVAGFVLAGGKSSRMGQDKALLPWGEGTLLDHVAGAVRAGVGDVTVIGRDIQDLVPDRGPLGGLLTALNGLEADWALIVAVDMPNLTAELVGGLAEAARESESDAVVCEAGNRLHPLCAAYHRRLLPAVEAAVDRKSLKMHDFLSTIRVERWPVPDPALLANVNTPEELLAWRNS
jgi:molybdopterin-guanine dinucleotide biosynthesis protein A